jgi:diguanylate cyclase (GGDEF)-like protein
MAVPMKNEEWLERTLSSENDDEIVAQHRYPYLIAYSGPDKGKRFPLQLRKLTLGRSPDADIVLNDRKISKIHCTIEYDLHQIRLEDNNSTNGLYVNGERVTSKVLTNNSHLQIGDTAMKIDYKDPEELKYEDDLIRKATTDPLSAIPNRAYFEQRAREELAFAQRANLPVAMAMIDIDLFKNVNDTHGHQAGDYVIGQIARLMYAQKRIEDILARYGGEEFVLLMRGTINKESALAVGERIRNAVEQCKFKFNDILMPVTISIGLCFETEREYKTLERLIQKADLALYRAKNNGRNRVEFYIPTGDTQMIVLPEE